MRLVKREPQEMPNVATGLTEGFHEIHASVYANPTTGQIVITGDPHDDEAALHSCDASGCGWEHVVFRGGVAGYALANVRAFLPKEDR